MEAKQRSDRSESFFIGDGHIRRYIDQQRRLEKEAAKRMTFAADGDFGAFIQSIANMLFHFFHRRHIDERTLADAFIHTVAHFQLRLHGLAEFCGKRVINTILHQNTIGADTGLPAIAVFRRYRTFDGGVEVGVVKNDKRGVATEFQRDFFDCAGALRHEFFADSRRAGKAEFAHDGIARQFTTNRTGISGNNADYPFGDAGAFGQFTKRQRRIRRL